MCLSFTSVPVEEDLYYQSLCVREETGGCKAAVVEALICGLLPESDGKGPMKHHSGPQGPCNERK